MKSIRWMVELVLVGAIAGSAWASTFYVEAVSNKDIVDEERFRAGLSKVIDGTVECLNASSWARTSKS